MAKLISYLLHPLFAPLFSAFLIFNLPLYLNYKFNPNYFYYVYAIIFMNLVAAPLMISLYLKRIKFIESLEMRKAKDRSLPFFISFIFYAFTYFLLSRINFPNVYLNLFVGAAITVFVLFLFSTVDQKPSAHLAALGGISGMLIILSVKLGVDLSNWLILLVLVSGIVGTARLQLKAHQPLELLVGFLLGIFGQLWMLL